MNTTFRFILATIVMLTMSLRAAGQMSASSVVNSPHNLSASGPGTIKASSEKQVCIFCHTPHNAIPLQPLWNRNLPVNAYRVYASSTLVSTPGQPTGSSKLCLSCHDGTIALGSILSRPTPIQMVNGVTTIPVGASNLGTDLTGDHPISFTYDSALVAKNSSLVDPAMLPPPIKLDKDKQLQCVSCHDPHDDTRGKFLVMDNTSSQLCNSCHIPSGEATITGHSQCVDCHQTHNSPSGPFLLTQATVTDTCTTCHGSNIPTSPAAGTPTGGTSGPMQALSAAEIANRGAARALSTAAPNIAADLDKFSRHKADVPSPMINASSAAAVSTSIVNCAGCHEPHTIAKGDAPAPNISPQMGKVSGVTADGARVARARFGYQVCFKCHSDDNNNPIITRKAVQTSIRRQFSLTAVSSHPIVASGRGHDVPSLAPGLTVASIISCTDCHNSDTSRKAGGGGPNGPHGSNNPPLLIANYVMVDGINESTLAYELCYRCHERTSILGNESFPTHRLHVVDQHTPCSVCHDGHGISSAQGTMQNNAHLINFDTSVVRPDPITKRLEYQSMGHRSGTCYLQCHGIVHSGTRYP
jgi:predicted CXXCH cytochrome family protein